MKVLRISRISTEKMHEQPNQPARCGERPSSGKGPNVGRDIVTMGYVKELEVGDNRVTFALQLATPAGPARDT